MVRGITYILTHEQHAQDLLGRNKANTKYKAYPNICPAPEKFPYSVVRQTGKSPTLSAFSSLTTILAVVFSPADASMKDEREVDGFSSEPLRSSG